ncbi:hypothetical protein PENTCL1PPCAC_6139, partial [Pristionchus entomophagus]
SQLVWLVLPLLLSFLEAYPVDSESDLPPYLRGIGWRKVEEELRKEMRLVSSLRPISYDINLNVSVRRYKEAERSTFEGSVEIVLNITSPITEIELHSVGLNIKTVELKRGSSNVEVQVIRYNRERETVIFKLSEALLPSDEAQLKVDYNGTAVMRGVGLYESWTENDKTSPLPSISLVSNCEPTGTRLWLPSFDEPDKKATFRLRLFHPNELTAYSNTEGETKALTNQLLETTFERTVPLPTYLVAFALTEQHVEASEFNGHKIRAIGKSNDRSRVMKTLGNTLNAVTNSPAFQNVTVFTKKTDWFIMEDFFSGAMENPGLITSNDNYYDQNIQVHELVHMYFGNLVTLRSWEQFWVNEGFAQFFMPEQEFVHFHTGLEEASLHAPALHSKFTYSKSQFLMNHYFTNAMIHYTKAAQLINLVKRFIGEEAFNKALNRYLIDNSFGNGDSAMVIDYLSDGNPEARKILNDWVYQPGVALLTVNEEKERVIIEQRRFLKTDFNEEMRDTKTRWTIPLYYLINGVTHMEIFPREVEKFVVDIPKNGSFSIDRTYSLLYAVHYKNRKRDDEISQIIAMTNNIDEISPNKSKYEIPNHNLRTSNDREWNERHLTFCDSHVANKTKEELMDMYLVKNDIRYLLCDRALVIKVNAKRFLHELLVSNDLPIRNKDVDIVAKQVNNLHSGILLEFLTEENRNIDSLGVKVCEAIVEISMSEDGAVEKLHNIVRVNPSFAANFYHMFTSIFEKDYIQREMKKRIDASD